MPYIGNQPGTGVRSRFIYTATASQTTFSGADDNSKTLKYADSDYIDVYLNGVCLVPGTDYTASTKTSVVLTQAASLNDTLEVVAYDIATISDTVSKADGGTFEDGVTIRTADNTTQLTLESTDADADLGPILDLFRNGGSPADSDFIGQVRFQAKDDGGNVHQYAKILGQISDVTGGTEDGTLGIRTILAGTDTRRIDLTPTETVINEDSKDLDFRVESDGNANMLFVDGENNKVGIANNAPKEALNVSGAHVVEGDHATGVNAMGGSAGILLHATGDTGFVTATSSGSNNRNLQVRALNAGSANSNQLRLDYLGNVGIGSSLPSSTYKFVVQSSTNQVTQLNYNSNASFTQDLHAWDTFRAGTSSFNFGRMRTNVGGSPDSEFIFNGAGTANADGSWVGGGADYAEYFEWKDGNSDSEDRVGITVKLDGNKIVAATSDDDTSLIIGAISSRPAVIGDAAWNKWKDKYETDAYGRYIREEYTVTEWTVPEVKDDEGNITSEEVKHSYQTDLIPSNLTAPDNATVISEDDNEEKLTRRKLNSSFDDSITYVSREERPEWDTVGMMGKLRIRKGQPTGDRWIKMRDISDTVEEWLVR